MNKAAKLEKRFGITAKEIERQSALWEAGEVVGEPVGEIIVGRPLKFGEQLYPIGFKETHSKIDIIDRRAADLGMSRSDYLRWVVDKDLDLQSTRR
jgi:uncharacterized protein YnzC (UPF0291/DUF896 family)